LFLCFYIRDLLNLASSVS